MDTIERPEAGMRVGGGEWVDLAGGGDRGGGADRGGDRLRLEGGDDLGV
jgi:hypothetical protein